MQRFGGVYEHSEWIAEAAYSALRENVTLTPRLISETMARIVDDAGFEKKLALLKAHPDLAGKLSIAGGLTESSSAEQKSAGLANCSPAEFDEFQSLNMAYMQRNEFPFILAVAGRDRADILDNFRSRIDNPKDTEFITALNEVHKIARLRIEKEFSQDN